MTDTSLIEMTSAIVSAYVGSNNVAANDIPGLIQSVHGTLKGIETGEAAPAPVAQTPAVSVKKSITPDYIVCLEDGRRFKSLKRHLSTKYDLSPDAYRAKWGLPKDYPMVAPNYAASRSALAKSMGLGQGGRKPAGKAPVAAQKAAAPAKAATAPAPAKRGPGRPRKA